MSHYDWLEENIDVFWVQVFGKTLSGMGMDGFIDSHGDKAYQYEDDWSEHGIHFFHGVLLYLLTYTSVMDRPKHKSSQWVIDNYPKYKEILPSLD